jgi:tyrosyl-tRNA synthetase
VPDDVPELVVTIEEGSIGICQLLKKVDLVQSTSEAMRGVQQGGVKVDSKKVDDKNLQLLKGSTVVLQVGKRKFAKVTII